MGEGEEFVCDDHGLAIVTRGWRRRVVDDPFQRSILGAIVGTGMPVNWAAQREMDRDVEENEELYQALADDPEDE